MDRAVTGAAAASPHHGLRHGVTERAVLDAFAAEGGPLSRADLSRRTSMAPPTISDAVRRLEEASILAPVGHQTGRAGAVPTLYHLAPAAGCVIGAALTPTVVRAMTTDLTGHALASAEHPLPDDPHPVAGCVDELVGRLSATAEAPVRAVAVSVANPVDPATGAVIELPEAAFPRGVIAPADLHVGPATAVLVDNDVNLAAMAESDRGAARGVATFVYLYVGRGRSVGLGIVVDGHLVRGARGLAGEIGYLPTRGRSGSRPRFGLGAALGEYSAAGDTTTLAPRDRRAVARLLGEAAASVCALVDPELVVLGGPVGMIPGLAEQVGAVVAEFAPRATPVIASVVGEDAPLQGALVRARRHAWSQLGSGR